MKVESKICTGEGGTSTSQTCTSLCQTYLTATLNLCEDESTKAQDAEGIASAKGAKKALIGGCTTEAALPAFDKTAAAAAIAALPVVVWDDSTPAATAAPTTAPAPAPSGFAYVKKVVKKKAVKVSVKFPVTSKQAAEPKMKKSLEGGFAKGCGVAAHRVYMSSINGIAVPGVSVTRRLATADTTIEFAVEALAGGDTTQLVKNIETAATSGALVSAVLEQAAENGVLTQDMKDMDVVLPKPAVVSGSMERTVEEIVSTTTPAPTPSTLDSGAGAISTSGICLALVLCQAAMLAFV